MLQNAKVQSGTIIWQSLPNPKYITNLKRDSNPNENYVISERALWTMNLIQVSSKSVVKWASYGHFKNSIWPAFSCHFEYLISFQNIFQLLNF